MAQITSGVGLISGINTGAIIDALVQLDQQPVTLLQARVSSGNAQKQAYSDLLTKLQSLQSVGQALERPTTFAASTATSSDSTVLTATAGPGAPAGSYQFQVAQLVSSQQSISNAYTSATAPLQAGTITLEEGGGNLDSATTLSALNGGAGVGRGQFRITDGSGKADLIDIGSAITLDDVVRKINTSLDISVHASVQGNRLVLSDSSGGTGGIKVQDLAGGTAAQDLGIAGSVNGNTLTGTSINQLATTTAIAALNDGRRIRRTSGTGDFNVTTGDGTVTAVNLGNVQTVGDVLTAINTAAKGKFKAVISPAGNGITLQDTSGGSGTLSVTDATGSHAATDLGIARSGATGSIQGGAILANIDSVLVSSLNGGSGLALGQLSITNRAGRATTVDLSGASSFQDVIDTLNNANAGITASLNASRTGLQIQDSSGGTGNLVLASAGGSKTAENLGIAGTFDNTKPAVDGGNLQLQWVSGNTLLSQYNGGKGVTLGSFKITNAAGSTATVDLSSGTFDTIGDVINAINAKNIGVTASINKQGNGLLLTDTTGGAGHLTVANVNGTTASDLNIAGAAAANTIDGSFEKTIQVTGADTLTTLQQKIQTLGFGVGASILNDGTGLSPYHLSLTAFNSGRAGRVIIDGGTTGLQTRNLVEGSDAAVFVGGSDSTQPLLVTGSSNQLSNVIPGVTITLQSASDKPVTLNIARDPSGIVSQLQNFTDTFNGIVTSLTTLTQYDTNTNQGGLLLGDSTAQEIQTQMYAVFNGVVSDAGSYRTLGDIGMTLTDGAKVQFDSNKLTAAYAANPEQVQTLFTEATTGLGALIDKSMTSLVDPVSGAIPLENQQIDTTNQQFQDQITSLNSLIADKKARLQEQFANMESVLAGLQGQQAALASLSTIASSLPKSSSTTSSSTQSSSGGTSGSGTGA